MNMVGQRFELFTGTIYALTPGHPLVQIEQCPWYLQVWFVDGPSCKFCPHVGSARHPPEMRLLVWTGIA